MADAFPVRALRWAIARQREHLAAQDVLDDLTPILAFARQARSLGDGK